MQSVFARRLFDFQNRSPEDFPFRLDSETGEDGGAHFAVAALGRAVGDADGDVAVEVRRSEPALVGAAVGEVGDGGGDNVATPAIFDGEGDAEGDAHIAHLAGFGDSAELADFDVHDVHRQVALGVKEHFERVDVFVEDERMVGVSSDREALLVRAAGLLDIDVYILDGEDNTHSFVLGPAGVGVGNEAVARLKLGRDGFDALDIHVRISADLELESAVAFGAVLGDFARHFLGRFLRDGSVEGDVIARPSTKQRTNGKTRGLSEDVPTRHIDSGFDVGVTLEG